MPDIFDTLTSNTATLDIFDELSPSPEGDIFDKITPSKSKVSTLGIVKKSLQQAPMSAAQSIGGIARAVGDITGIESVKQYGKDVYKGAEIELERERPEMETGLQKGIYGATQSIAQNMPGLALSAVTGSPIPALLAAGALSGGKEYGEAREAGIEPIKAGAGAAGTAISEMATEYIPLGYLLQPGLSLAKRMLFSTISELVGENVNTVAQKAIQWWERNPDKTTGEFVSELYPDAKQTSLQVLLSSPVMALGGQALTKLTPTTKATTTEQAIEENLETIDENRKLAIKQIQTKITPRVQPKDIFDELQPETPPETIPPIKENIKTGTEAGESLIPQEAAPVVAYFDKPNVPSAQTEAEDKVKAGSLAFGMDLPKYTASINLNNWDITYDVKKLTADIVEKSGIQKTKKTFEQIRQEAEEIGMTEKQLVKKKNIPIDKMAAEITAMRDVAVNTVQQTRYVMDEALKIATDETKSQDIRDEALTIALLKMSKAGTVLKQVDGTSSEIARALGAHRMKVNAYKATNNYKAMLDALGGREVGLEILRKLAAVDPNDTKASVIFIRDVQQAKTMDMVYEAWRNAILSSPKTILTNAISNTVTSMIKPIEKLTAASLEAGKQFVTGKPRQVFFGEVKAETLGAIQGIKEGFRVGLQSFVTELPSDTETKIEMAKGTAIPGKTGRIIRYPQRLLMATDEMFKAMMYRSELNSLAYRKASLEGKRGQERIDAMAEYLLNPTEDMIKKSRNESLYRTYNKPLGKFGNQVMQLRESDPSGTLKYILPFIRTPVNIFKFGLERTPINFARLGYLISKGKITDDIAEELSKPLLGSAIGMGVAMLVAQGFITGGTPKEKEKKDALYRTGWQPYSFKIGEKYIPYNRIEPMGSIVGSVADYVELFEDKKPQEIDEMTGRIATSIAKNWTNKTFLLGLSNAINAIQDPERYGENLIQSFAGSLVPNIVATTAKATDETLRQPRTVLEAMKTRIPYLDRSVLHRQDIWGRDIQKFGKGIIGKVSRGMSPVVVSEASKDPVDIEMVRLLQSVDLAISLPQERIQGIKLPPELYREYVQKSGELAYKLINSAIATPEYQKLQDDEIKYKIIRNTIDKARDAYKPVIINKIFETSKYKHLIPKNLNLR